MGEYRNMVEYRNAFNSINYDRLNIMVPKGRRKDIKAYAESKGMSINGLIATLLQKEMGLSDTEWKKNANKEE